MTTTPHRPRITRPRIDSNALLGALVHLRISDPAMTRTEAIGNLRRTGNAVSWDRLCDAWRTVDLLIVKAAERYPAGHFAGRFDGTNPEHPDARRQP